MCMLGEHLDVPLLDDAAVTNLGLAKLADERHSVATSDLVRDFSDPSGETIAVFFGEPLAKAMPARGAARVTLRAERVGSTSVAGRQIRSHPLFRHVHTHTHI